MDGLEHLSHRIAQLDLGLGNAPVTGGSIADLVRFVMVLSQVTSTGTVGDVRRLPCRSPADADALLEGSRLITRLQAAAPEIVAGSLRRDAQYWIATGKPSHVPRGETTLHEAHFVGVTDGATLRESTKPFGIGLFTATGVFGTHGMCRIYLDLNRGSTLHPLPWYTWAVHACRAVYEITSAVQWVEFVRSYPVRDGALLYPDWKAVAREWDAVHMTVRAIAATQGLFFATEDGIVAAPYWDIESTLWLRWCFTVVDFVEVTAE